MQKTKNKNISFILSCLIFLCISIFIFNPAKYMQSITDGLYIWATAVVPSLFPFFVLSKLLIELNFFDKFCKYISPVTQKLFKAPAISGYIFLISIISGYPVGAKLVQEYYKSGIITQTQCKKIATFTSTSGPLFILGTVGTKFFNNSTLGFLLLGCHILSAVLCGFFYRNFYCSDDNTATAKKQEIVSKNILNDSIYSSVISILTVGAFISLFYMLTDMLLATQIIDSPYIQAFVTGLFEVTRGCQFLSSLNLTMTSTAVLCGTLISFGGLCIMLQSYTYLKDCGVSFAQLFGIKTVQASIMAIVTYVASIFIF